MIVFIKKNVVFYSSVLYTYYSAIKIDKNMFLRIVKEINEEFIHVKSGYYMKLIIN
jgi:hypothetical protein